MMHKASIGLAALVASLIFLFSLILYTATGRPDAALTPIATVESPWDLLQITPDAETGLCWQSSEEAPPWKDGISNPPFPYGIGWGMGGGDFPDAVQMSTSTYGIEAGAPTTARFNVHFLGSELQPEASINLRYLIILDEQQLYDAFGPGSGPYHDIGLAPGEGAALDLHIPSLDPGIHNLMVLGFEPLEPDKDHYGFSSNYFPFRLSLVVGDSFQLQQRSYEILDIAEHRADEPGVFTLGLHLDQTQKVWVWPDAYLKASESAKFYISVGYLDGDYSTLPELAPFALLAFLDYEQVEIRPGEQIFYGAVTPETAYSFIPAEIDLSEQSPGKHSLLVLRIPYPQMPICLLRQALPEGPDGYWFDDFIYPFLAGIEVE